MNSKIIIGIIIGIVIIIGIGFSVGNYESQENKQIIDNNQVEIADNSEGRQITLELNDSVTAIGP